MAKDLWISVDERLPEQYRDVPILNKDGSQRVARLNHQGVWESASYQKCRHAYAANPVMWFDTPTPPTRDALKKATGEEA